MLRSWCYLSICWSFAGILLAKYPLQLKETCAGFETIDVSRLPRFEIKKFIEAEFNSVLLLDTTDITDLNRIPYVKQYRTAVEGRPDQVDAYELRGKAPNCTGRILVIYRNTQDRPGDPCMRSELTILPDGAPFAASNQNYFYNMEGAPITLGDVILFTPERDIVTIAFCIERKGSRCTKGLLCVTVRNAMRPLSRKRRNQILRVHERVGFFREFGVRASDIGVQDPRLNDCEFPPSILTRSNQRRPSYNRSYRRRKNYKY